MPSPVDIRQWKKKAVLFSLEAAYNDGVALTGADWFEARNVVLTPIEVESEDRNIEQPYMGNSGKLITAMRKKLAFDVALANSGIAGVVPKIGKLLRACGFAENINEADGGTATAGGASTATLAATASVVDDAYKDMSITITAGTGVGQVRVISGYVGATKVATVSEAWATVPDVTSVYSVRDKVVYSLISETFESGVFYVNMDGVLHKGQGSRGAPSFNLDAKSSAKMRADLMALYMSPTDAAPPVVDRTGWPYEKPVNAANTQVCTVNGVNSFYSKFSVNPAYQVAHGIYAGGYEEIKIGSRQPSASISVLAELLATFDPYALIEAQTSIPLQVIHGTLPGGKVQIDLKTKIISANEIDIDGSVGYDLSLSPDPVTGDDEITITFL